MNHNTYKSLFAFMVLFMLLVLPAYGSELHSTITNEPELVDHPWPMKCHDLRHTSQSPFSTVDNMGEEIWRFKTIDDGGAVESSPIVGSDGTIYFGSLGSDRKLYAVNPDGTLKWYYQAGGLIWAAPAIAENGTIYTVSYDDYLYALNPDGTLKWKFNAGDSLTTSPAIANDGAIYFGVMGPGDKGRIYAINPNGTEKWHYDTGYWILSEPAISNDNTIYIGSEDKYLYAMNPNGTMKWRYKTGDIIKGHPSIAADGAIYIPSWDNYLHAVHPNGTMKWKTETKYASSGSAAIANDGTIYYGSNRLRAFYPENGTIKWVCDIGGSTGHTTPAISAEGTIYACNTEGNELLAISPDGEILWRKTIAEVRADSSPVIGSDGTIYVGSTWEKPDGHWYGFLLAFHTLDPNAPDPPTIDGPTSGKYGEEYDYMFTAVDPNNDNLYYYINWGDGGCEYKIGPYASGETVTVSHKWEFEGEYTIQARAIDTNNLWGDWSALDIRMPVSQTLGAFPLLRLLCEFLSWFPNLFPLLRFIVSLNI